MTHRTQVERFSRNRKLRWEKRLRQLAQMRAAKERKRIARGPVDEPPKMKVVRHPFLSWAVRDDLSGEVCWMPMVSARDVYRRISVLLKFYQPNRTKL